MGLCERTRPQTWRDVVGQEKAVAAVMGDIARNGWGGRFYWLAGPTGTGKTSLARLIASNPGNRDGASDWAICEMDAGELTCSILSDMMQSWHCHAIGKGGWALILNEAHGLRQDVIRRLLTVQDSIPKHVVVILTTTDDAEDVFSAAKQDALPLVTRCLRLPWNKDTTQAAAEHVQRVAKGARLDGQPIEAYMALAERCHGSIRAMLNEVDAGIMLEEGSAK